ncbi:arsenate reductase ArsC [Vogesella sp. GCM10023246]|uniref:Arsenate reductase ArsC n=1 Tax=Vogesella oryzagri TaxID=3160864 RepID=A0ABV1MA35_9NEIS
MTDKVYNVLILCTGNSARSILGEALINHLGQGHFKGYSAGSQPTGKVNPYALKTLQKHGLTSEGYRSKSWDEFAVAGAPQMDFVFTVCGNADGETCPLWPGHPMRAHWGVDDPAGVGSNDEEAMAAFAKAFMILKRRVELFMSLPVDKLDALALKQKLVEIGEQ